MANYVLSAVLTAKDGLTAVLKNAARAAQDLTRGVGGVSRGIGDIKRTSIKLDVQGLDKLNRLKSMAQGMTFSPTRVNLQDNASPKLANLKTQLTSLTSRAHNIAVNVQTRGAEQLNRLKSNVSELGSGMMMATGAGVMGVAGVGYGVADTINTYKDFELQMRRNKALFTTGMSPEDAQPIYERLVDTARRYGSTMIYTNAEVGKALEFEALAGWDANTSMKGLPAILNAAVASGEDLADNMTAMGYKAGTYVKNGMGEMVEATQHFSDVLLRTTLRSNTNFQALGYAMKYAAPLANALGYSIEDVAIAMGLMANNGIKADQAGTGLRGIMLRMINEPKKTAAAMESLGLSMFDADGKTKGLMATLMDVRAKLRGKDAESMLDFVEQMTGEQIGERGEIADFLRAEMAANGGKLTDKSFAKLASGFSGTYALAPFLALMNSTDEDIKKLMTEIYQKSDGTGAEINKEMMDTLHGDLKTLQSAWEDFQYELMNGAGASGLRDFLQAVTKDINAFKTALKDGFDVGDIFGLVGNMVSQLKNKFLELDGIGSLLAGGVLMVGLKKLLNMGLRVRNALGEITRLNATTAATSTAAARGASALPAVTSSVGTMNVRAGVVNLSGAINGKGVVGGTAANQRTVTPLAAAQAQAQSANAKLLAAQTAATAATARAAQTRLIPDIAAARQAQTAVVQAQAAAAAANRRVMAIQNSQIATQKYYAQREAEIVNQQVGSTAAINAADTAAKEARAARIANIKSAGVTGAAFAGIFGVMDVMSTRSMGKAQIDEIDVKIAEQKQQLQELRDNKAEIEQINNQVATIRKLEDSRNEVIKQTRADEFRAGTGAVGSMAGAAIGAMLGSLVGPMGTMFGGMVGGMVGQHIGEYVGDQRVQSGLVNQQPQVNAESFIQEFNQRSLLGAAIQRAQGEQPQYEFKNPLEQTNIDRTGLRRTTFFEPNEPLPQPTVEPSDEWAQLRRDLGGTPRHHIRDEASNSFEAVWARREARDAEDHEKWQREHYGGQATRLRSDQGIQQPTFQSQPIQQPTIKPPEFKLPEFKLPEFKLPETPLRSDQTLQTPKFETQPPVKAPEFNFAEWLDGLFFSKVAASELNETQRIQQAAMERGEVVQPQPLQPQGVQSPEMQPLQSPELGVEGLTENLYSQLEGLQTGVSEIFSGLGESINTGLTSALEGAAEMVSTFGTTITEGLNGAFTGVGEMVSTFGTTITEGLNGAFTGVSEMVSTFGTTITEGLNGAFTGVGEVFSGLSMQIGAGLETARATAEASMMSIRASFDSGLQSIQAAWGALPGFFSGVFSGLGGAASAAGSAIYAGLTAPIGAIIGAWQSAASQISAIISGISAQAGSIGAPSIGANYSGTANWEGGLTTVNEHGGELMILPQGTRIYPHATTVELLRHEIQDRLRTVNNFSDAGLGEFNFNLPASEADFNADLPVPQFRLPDISGGDNSTSNTTTNNTSSNTATFNFGGFTFNNGMDFDEFVYKFQSLFTGAANNSIEF